MGTVVYIDRDFGEGTIGEGSAGSVFEVHASSGVVSLSFQRYALKVPRRHTELKGFIREKNILRRLQRDASRNHIVRVFSQDVAVYDGDILGGWRERSDLSCNNVLMELALGTLKSIAKPQDMSSKDRLQLLLKVIPQALEALRYCHARGYAHLDVKAENFLCLDSSCCDIVLCDFSTAWSGPDDGAFLRPRGTMPYIAPEQRTWLENEEHSVAPSFWCGCADSAQKPHELELGSVPPQSPDGGVGLSHAKLMDWYSTGFLFFETLCPGAIAPSPSWLRDELIRGAEEPSMRGALGELIVGLLQRDPQRRLDPDRSKHWGELLSKFGGKLLFQESGA